MTSWANWLLRGRRGLLGGLVCLFMSSCGTALAAPERKPGPAPSLEEQTRLAQPHFESGVRLYRDGHYAAALSEFEAAYHFKPGAPSLQNIALCLKALLRYADAKRSLSALLERHVSDLSASERQTIEQAIAELDALVGSLVIRTVPADAVVTLDSHELAPQKRQGSLELDAGEHRLDVQAPGYAAEQRTVQITAGAETLVEISLEPATGFLEVVTSDPRAAIAVDGRAIALSRWQGPLSPGRHFVQVYLQGYKTVERNVSIELGETSTLEATLEPIDPDAIVLDVDPPNARSEAAPRGFYGLVTLNVLRMNRGPQAARDVQAEGGTLGVRAGYRLLDFLGTELSLDGGPQTSKPSSGRRGFTFDTVRFGPLARFTSTGRRLRFTSAIGPGVAFHSLQVERDPLDPEQSPGGKAKGAGAYFLLELGAQLNLGHLLLEADLVAHLHSVGSVTGTIDNTAGAAFGDAKSISMVGISLRVGYSHWTHED